MLIKNSKAGCTSLAALLEEYSTGELVVFDDIHLHRHGVFQGPYDWRMFELGFASERTTCFSFVRNPVSRLVSCFSDFFVDLKNGDTNQHLPPMEDRGFELTSSVDRNFEVFVDYVAESIADAPDICNRHWREQVCNLGFGHVTLDFIGKLETYQKDLQNLFEVQGERAFLERSKSWRRQFNTSAKTDVSISDATRRKILRVYARDCEAFGY